MSVEFKIGYISHRNSVPFALKKNTMHDTDITFVHSGKMQYITDNDKVITVKEGQGVFFTRGDIRQRIEGTEPAMYTSLIIRHKEPLSKRLPTLIHGTNTYDVKYCLDKLLDLATVRTPFAEEMADGLIKYLFGVLHEICFMKKTNMYVYDMQKFISNNYTQKLTLNDISSHVHISVPYALSIFKKETGIPINQYLRNVRIDAAKQLLKYSDDSIEEIALKTGFCDPFYFSRTFRVLQGVSPRQFRKEYIEGKKRLMAVELNKKI